MKVPPLFVPFEGVVNSRDVSWIVLSVWIVIQYLNIKLSNNFKF